MCNVHNVINKRLCQILNKKIIAINLTTKDLPSLKRCAFRVFFPKPRTSSGVKFLNGWFSATMCIEKPNTKIANTTRNRPKSFIKSPMIMAHGPNKWWNDKKSRICTHANRNDIAKHWFRPYINVGQYSIFTKNIAAVCGGCWEEASLIVRFLCCNLDEFEIDSKICTYLYTIHI